MKGLYNLFDINSRIYFGKEALIGPNEQRYTYGKLATKVNALAYSLNECGVEQDDHVGFMFKNGVEFITSLYAIFKLGAVAVPFSSSLFDDEIIQNLETAQCSAFLFDASLPNDIDEITRKATGVTLWVAWYDVTHNSVSISSTQYRHATCYDYANLLKAGMPTWNYSATYQADDKALLLFTGGTTGKPKCVVHTHENALMFFSLPMMSDSVFKPSDVMLYYAPLYHLAGMSYLFYILSLGATLVVMDRFNPERYLNLIDKEKITQLFIIPPTLVHRLKEACNGHKLTSVKWVIMSGGLNSVNCAREVFRLFPEASLCNTYGQTERAANTILYLTREEFEEDRSMAASIGAATQFSEIRLTDEQGRETNQGEAYARCPGMFKEYLGVSCPFQDGWFPTGDILRKNDSGYYWFVDRSKDMIKTGGENVFSLEVENAINIMPAIRECAVFGLFDARFGEAVSVACVIKEGYECTQQQVSDWCKSRLAGFKRPKHIFFLNKLPRNSLGKIQKEQLRKQFSKSELQ